MKITLLALFLSGCALTTPNLSERSLSPLTSNWATTRASIIKVLSINNPLSMPVQVTVTCSEPVFTVNGVYGKYSAPFDLAAKETYHRLMVVPVRYGVGEMCAVTSWDVLVDTMPFVVR